MDSSQERSDKESARGNRSEVQRHFAFASPSNAAAFAPVVRTPSTLYGRPRSAPYSNFGVGTSLLNFVDSLGEHSPSLAEFLRSSEGPGERPSQLTSPFGDDIVALATPLSDNAGPSGSASQISRASRNSGGAARRPPRTPPSNFNIQMPDSSSDDGSPGSGGDGMDDEDPEDIFPPGCEIGVNLREIIQRRMREASTPDPVSIDAFSGDVIVGDNGSIHSAAIRRRRQLLEGRVDNGLKDVVMCIIWAGQRFAASYYDLETGQLFMLPDMSDAPPDFDILRSAFNQIHPTYVLVNKNSEERFLKVVYELTGHAIIAPAGGGQNEDSMEDREDEARSHNDSVYLYQLPSRDFAPDSCKMRVYSLKLPYEPKNNGQQEHVLFVSSLIPFSNENMIRTMGCLLKFLDNKAIEVFQLEMTGGQVPVVDVNLFKMDDLVLVDDTAWHSLQIFSTDIHPSSLKQGRNSGHKEGLSVYSLLNECVTTQGSKKLRLMLLRPSRNMELLSRRYDVIQYCMNPNNLEFVKSAIDALKAIKSLPKLLYRLSLLHATVNEWKEMYQTMYHCLLLGEMCGSLESAPYLIKEIGNPDYINILRALTQEMMAVIDFEESATANRIVARTGLDDELDKKKRQIACLPEIMSIVASEEINDLPPYVTQCCAVYIPEVGYLLAVTMWGENLSDRELRIENLEYRFRTPELVYYKSARMRELDIILGDCAVFILEKETLIMVRLSEMILQRLSTLLKINDNVSEFDSLLAISKLSRSYDFTRPELVPAEEKMKIIDSWHPLSDLLCNFVKNSVIFRGPERVVVITGPNASGKSVYLKQVGVIVLMALSGCYVPAIYAQIPMFDKICTRIHSLESVSTGFSTFMVDINQVSLAIRSSCKKSLIIIDEFGKGTTEADGLAILTASIQDFIDRKEDCPTIFLSTHFYSMMKYLKPSPLLKFQTMKFVDVNGTITYLFELIDGKCEKSFACLMAKGRGVPAHVVERAAQIEKVVIGENQEAIRPRVTEQQAELQQFMISIAEEFQQINFDKVDPIVYLQGINRKYEALLNKGNIDNIVQPTGDNDEDSM